MEIFTPKTSKIPYRSAETLETPGTFGTLFTPKTPKKGRYYMPN
jgi:hypothetical protein